MLESHCREIRYEHYDWQIVLKLIVIYNSGIRYEVISYAICWALIEKRQQY